MILSGHSTSKSNITKQITESEWICFITTTSEQRTDQRYIHVSEGRQAMSVAYESIHPLITSTDGLVNLINRVRTGSETRLMWGMALVILTHGCCKAPVLSKPQIKPFKRQCFTLNCDAPNHPCNRDVPKSKRNIATYRENIYIDSRVNSKTENYRKAFFIIREKDKLYIFMINMLRQKQKRWEMKTGLIQNNYIQLFHLFVFYKYILLQLKSSQRLKTAPLTEDGCEYPHLFTDRGFCTENHV